ncbi:MAG: HD domain-containing protein [Clostridia bacterium]|nr:HD domain-containing protein [Clostridia bacterium]
MIKIPDNVQEIIEKLEAFGHEAYIVGGCVRDTLIGIIPDDYDITTSASPDEVKSVLNEYKIIDTGIDHGTVTVLSKGTPIEVTTYRYDGEYTDHRRPDSVILTKELSEDLKRRDFTVNSLAYNKITGLVDLYEGEADLNCGIIRCVGEPEQRFKEDALRIIRALRFSAVLGFKIEEKTEVAIHKLYPLLEYVSMERISTELKKLICGKAEAVFDILTRFSDVICFLIPEMKPAVGLDQKNKWHIYDVYTHIAKVVESTPPILNVRLAALFHDIAKPKMMFLDDDGVGHFWGHPEESAVMTEIILRRMKFDNHTIKSVCRLIEIHDVRPEATKKALRKYLSKYNDIDPDEIMMIRRADLKAQNPEFHSLFDYLDDCERIIRKIKSENLAIKISDLNINGNDITSLGAKGETVGKILSKLLSDVVEEKIPNDKDILLSRAAELFRSMK